MAFLTEPEPPRGVAIDILPGVRRITARNPTPMTYHGTNTYFIDGPDGLTLLDPGPDQPQHVEDILAAAGAPIARILLSHTHHDHHGALAALKAATGAPTYGYVRLDHDTITTDHGLEDGDEIAGLTAVFTPGHAADHLSFAMPGGVLFSADHVMGWSTSVVSPPGGNMADYFRSLGRLLERSETVYLPGHGPKLTNPHPYIESLLRHRMQREAAIADALQAGGPADTHGLMDKLYGKLNPTLRRAAERNVLAHLEKLQNEGRARREGERWAAA